jgi:F-type H+-transporting ATPase subunit gamma
MSKRRDLEEHVRTLGEMEAIMGAMKNLALTESHKLRRLLDSQQRVVADIEAAGQDFLSFHPSLAPARSGHDLYIVIGAERGFCGDFNDRLLSALDRHLHETGERNPVLIVVGRKLLQRAKPVYRLTGSVEGPTVAEEVPSVLTRVSDQVREVTTRHRSEGRLSLTAVYHDTEAAAAVVRPLRAFHRPSHPGNELAFGPVLNLPPDLFFAQLVDLYLFSLLHSIFYSALLAESRARLSHVESTLHRLEREQADLLRKRNVLRQEEITEEIEVLMLSADGTEFL